MGILAEKASNPRRWNRTDTVKAIKILVVLAWTVVLCATFRSLNCVYADQQDNVGGGSSTNGPTGSWCWIRGSSLESELDALRSHGYSDILVTNGKVPLSGFYYFQWQWVTLVTVLYAAISHVATRIMEIKDYVSFGYWYHRIIFIAGGLIASVLKMCFDGINSELNQRTVYLTSSNLPGFVLAVKSAADCASRSFCVQADFSDAGLPSTNLLVLAILLALLSTSYIWASILNAFCCCCVDKGTSYLQVLILQLNVLLSIIIAGGVVLIVVMWDDMDYIFQFPKFSPQVYLGFGVMGFLDAFADTLLLFNWSCARSKRSHTSHLPTADPFATSDAVYYRL
eukprot:ANDGO_01408.mRNA.1 hypothetical protein